MEEIIMMNFNNKIFIQKRVEEVFAFIADFRNIPKWNYYVMTVEKLTKEGIDLGTVYHQVRKNDNQDFEIIKFKRNKILEIETLPEMSPVFRILYCFDPYKDGTILTNEWDLTFGQNSLIEALGKYTIKKAVMDNLIKLKQLLEEGKTILQDGRVMKV